MDSEALIIDAVRSPRGKGKPIGGLHEVHPQRVLAQVLEALRERNDLDTSDVDDVIMGCSSGSGDHSMDIARMAALDAGWSLDAPGVTLNRFCGSGQQAVNFAAMGLRSGFQDLVVAGGVESMSRTAPLHADGFAANNAHLLARYDMVGQGISADLIATIEGFTRTECDQLAVASQERTQVAVNEGRFDRALVPICHDDGTLALDHDEHPRPGTTVADLADLPPSFAGMGAHRREGSIRTIDETALLAYSDVGEIHHVHHAGNSSGVVDGASALLLATPDYRASPRYDPQGSRTHDRRSWYGAGDHADRPGPCSLPVRKESGNDL